MRPRGTQRDAPCPPRVSVKLVGCEVLGASEIRSALVAKVTQHAGMFRIR